jgi:bidirectional [NiFe] hydrogenase diaphorase subunit
MTSPDPSDHPSGDRRFKLLDAAMKKHRYRADALLEVLHAAQGLFGHLEVDLLYYIAHHLKQPLSRVYGVATFYHFFTFTPKATHSCVVCLGTACYVKGGALVQSALEQELGIKAGETRADGQASLQIARCLGTCGLAPLAIFDSTVAGNVTAERARDHVKGWVTDGTR